MTYPRPQHRLEQDPGLAGLSSLSAHPGLRGGSLSAAARHQTRVHLQGSRSRWHWPPAFSPKGRVPDVGLIPS